MIDDKDKMRLFILDYEHTCAIVTHLDKLIFQIKGWLITLWSVIIVICFNTGDPQVILISFFPIFIFGFIEYKQKYYQQIFIRHLEDIEREIHQKQEKPFYPRRSVVFKDYIVPSERKKHLKGESKFIVLTFSPYYYFYLSMLVATIGIWVLISKPIIFSTPILIPDYLFLEFCIFAVFIALALVRPNIQGYLSHSP